MLLLLLVFWLCKNKWYTFSTMKQIVYIVCIKWYCYLDADQAKTIYFMSIALNWMSALKRKQCECLCCLLYLYTAYWANNKNNRFFSSKQIFIGSWRTTNLHNKLKFIVRWAIFRWKKKPPIPIPSSNISKHSNCYSCCFEYLWEREKKSAHINISSELFKNPHKIDMVNAFPVINIVVICHLVVNSMCVLPK